MTFFLDYRIGFEMDRKLIVRYILLILGVSIMSLGIALSLKSTLGTENHIVSIGSNVGLCTIRIHDRFQSFAD